MSAVVRPPMPPPTMIAFMGPNSTQPWTQPELRASHDPLFGRKRLCGLRLELGPGLRLSLNSEVLEILPVPHAVAENLLLARQILGRAKQIPRAVPGGGPHREGGIDQMRPAKGHEIGTAGGENGIDLVRGRNVADTHGGDP